MSLAEQRSTQRIVQELTDEMRAGSLRKSPTSPSATIEYIGRIRRTAGSGHRRILSTPGASASSEVDVRARTLSGGAFGKTTNMSDGGIVNPRDRMRGPVTALTSPVVNKSQLTSTSVPGPKEKVEGETVSAAEMNAPKQRSSSSLPSPIVPVAFPSTQPAQHEPSASHPQAETSPTTPEARIIKSSVPPPSSLLPSPPHSPINLSLGNIHSFAAVADIEKSVSPSKKRSGNLPTSSMREKGKGRETGERPGEGRAQTMRRGFIGPAGIMR